MSIVHLIVKQELVLNLIYIFPKWKEKCNFLSNSLNVLYYGTVRPRYTDHRYTGKLS